MKATISQADGAGDRSGFNSKGWWERRSFGARIGPQDNQRRSGRATKNRPSPEGEGCRALVPSVEELFSPEMARRK